MTNRYAENGSLGQTLKAFGKLNERLVANYVVKILEGLHYLHQNDVVRAKYGAVEFIHPLLLLNPLPTIVNLVESRYLILTVS